MRKKRAAKRRLEMLSNAASIVETVCDSEQDCMDNYPENLQGTEKFERMEDAVDSLSDALERLMMRKDISSLR